MKIPSLFSFIKNYAHLSIGMIVGVFMIGTVYAMVTIPPACSTPGDCDVITPAFETVTAENGFFHQGTNIFQTMTGKVEWMPTSVANFDDNIGIPLNGQTVTGGVALYPDLAAKITAGTIEGVATIAGADLVMADYNQVGSAQGGYFLRGLGNRAVGAFENYFTALPTVTPFGTSNPGNHTHTVTDERMTNNTGEGDDAGDHSFWENRAGTTRITSAAGGHTHTLTGGDAETAPKAVSGLWYVFALKNN